MPETTPYMRSRHGVLEINRRASEPVDPVSGLDPEPDWRLQLPVPSDSEEELRQRVEAETALLIAEEAGPGAPMSRSESQFDRDMVSAGVLALADATEALMSASLAWLAAANRIDEMRVTDGVPALADLPDGAVTKLRNLSAMARRIMRKSADIPSDAHIDRERERHA